MTVSDALDALQTSGEPRAAVVRSALERFSPGTPLADGVTPASLLEVDKSETVKIVDGEVRIVPAGE